MQTNKLTEKPFAQVAAAIQALDLESVKLRLMDPELGQGWTREYADGIETAYKTYLTLAAKYQDEAEDILLAKDVDEFWHTHILQTMKYADDCQAAFGAFLHHEPHVGKVTQELRDKRSRLAEKTRALYEREFGGTHNAEEAWAGRLGAAAAAMSSIAMRSTDAAMSSIAIRSTDAAMSSIAIHPEAAAMSSIAIKSEAAAMSSIAIRAEAAAMSSIAIRASNAAMSSIAIDADRAAMSSVAFRPENAAMSSIALRATDTTLSDAAPAR